MVVRHGISVAGVLLMSGMVAVWP